MSFDRYVAICNPLHYHMIMNCRVCVLLAVTCWFLALMEVVPIVVILSDFTCYFSTEINHFFCDVIPLIKLICNDTSRLDLAVFVIAAFLSTLPSVLTFTPYIFIIITILRINSSTGRRKAFHTCSSHLTVVIMFYVTLICQYLRPASSENVQANKLIALFNTSATPVLNPLIYSLNNKDVKIALRHRLKKCKMVV
ncbi:olfactory receptor 2T5-like [Bombina bombina]|uniref:olfactory receptor 2T5-like n=1 Tax=Bombina bombina TaxID=8345 RepID=UPI00235A64F4|nr:olfactory receptor 2T5-like [Bombina bombina]